MVTFSKICTLGPLLFCAKDYSAWKQPTQAYGRVFEASVTKILKQVVLLVLTSSPYSELFSDSFKGLVSRDSTVYDKNDKPKSSKDQETRLETQLVLIIS